MIQNNIAIFIEKFIAHELSESEVQELLDWLKEDDRHVQVFNDHIEINNLLQRNALHFNASEAYTQIETFIGASQQPKKHAWVPLLKYAAVFIGIIGIGLYFFNSNELYTHSKSSPDVVTLELENGKIEKIDFLEQKTINNNKGRQLIGVKGQHGLNYEKVAPAKELVYNILRIPYGKIFHLVLSDGTKIVLNSGTTIKYPTCFLPNQKREVFLTGEAYFEVTKDSLRQFVVSTENQEVVVYGTKFNVSAYENEAFTKTVLVEGSVGVSSGNARVKIIPGEMAISEKANSSIVIKEVNSAEYIAWTQNEIVFVSKKFSEIIKTLERKFDVTIINKYKSLNDQVFTATFGEESLTDILSLFAKSRPFEFTINGNIITITKIKKSKTKK